MRALFLENRSGGAALARAVDGAEFDEDHRRVWLEDGSRGMLLLADGQGPNGLVATSYNKELSPVEDILSWKLGKTDSGETAVVISNPSGETVELDNRFGAFLVERGPFVKAKVCKSITRAEPSDTAIGIGSSFGDLIASPGEMGLDGSTELYLDGHRIPRSG